MMISLIRPDEIRAEQRLVIPCGIGDGDLCVIMKMEVEGKSQKSNQAIFWKENLIRVA